jgi:Glycosyl hydrolase family 71
MVFNVGALKACARLVCISFIAVLSGCNSDDSTPNGSSTSTSAGSAVVSSASAATTASTGTSASSTSASSTGSTAAAQAPATSSLVTSYNGADACLPLTMPSADALFASTKKVFAHYFLPFPLSLDNVTAVDDYYNTQYLNIHGESNKWLAQGGYLRQRPVGVSPNSNSDWQLLNMEAEVRSAIARGITGFTFDVMSTSEVVGNSSPLSLMLSAAQAVDSRFKIVVMPDLSALGSNSSAVMQIITAVASSPAAYRLSDGRLVVAAFDASVASAAWWQSVMSQLSAKGINIAFVPVFLGWTTSAAAFAPISYGLSDWGTATAIASSEMQGAPGTAHSSYGKIFMMPVDPQQFRPKDYLYWEAGNSAAFRAAWTSSIQGDADWVQVVTWNDYSESGQISPYTDATLRTDIGTGYYDLNGYYAAWFLTGQQPQITHDVLYYFYRREPSTAPASAQSKKEAIAGGTGKPENDIELVAFLTAPGVLKITIGGNTYTQNASAGIVSFKIPSQPGTPLFTLSRNGSDVFSFTGGVYIYGSGGLPSGVEDLTYWSGSASKSGMCAL